MAKDYKEKYQGKEKIREEIPIEDLVVGEYYYCNDPGFNIQMIFIYDGRKHLPSPHRVNKIEGGDEDRILTKNHLVIEQSLYKKEGALWYTGRGGRLASAREKMWLNMCIAKNEFIKKIPNDEEIDKFVSSSFKVADSEVPPYLTYDNTIKKDQKELVYEDFYQGQKFVGYIEEKYCEGRITIEDEYVYLCQNKVTGADCDNKQGFKFSYTISNERKKLDAEELDGSGFRVKDLFLEKSQSTIIADTISKEILDTALKMGTVPTVKYLDKSQSELTPSDFYTGQRFEGTIRKSFCKGKIYVDEKSKRIYLCQDEEDGDKCDDRQGFTHSYVIYLGPNNVLFGGGGISVKNLKIEKPWTFELQHPEGLGLSNTVIASSGVAFGGMNMSSGEVFPPSEYIVYLSDPGMAKLGVVKTVKDYTGLGLKEAKDLVDISGPFSDDTLLKEGMSKEAAEEFKKKLEDAGATARVERKVLLPNATRMHSQLVSLESFDPKIKRSDPTEYFAVLDLDDKADDRLFNNYMEDLSFIGFSKLGGHPIFKVRDNDLTPEELFDKVFSKIVSELKASLMPIDEEELDYHLKEADMPIK